MAELKGITTKQLEASGAVTTNNKAGLLLYASVTGDTAGDKVDINDGATGKITLIIPANNGMAKYNPRKGNEANFSIDIDAVITKAGADVFATFIYRESA